MQLSIVIVVFIGVILFNLTGIVKTIKRWCHDQLILYVNNNMDIKSPDDTIVNVDDSFNTITIQYTYLSKNYKICTPFDRKYFLSMMSISAKLIYYDGSTKDITQYPGIPYTISAKELGGRNIILTNVDTSQSWSYPDHIIPNFGKEIFYEE